MMKGTLNKGSFFKSSRKAVREQEPPPQSPCARARDELIPEWMKALSPSATPALTRLPVDVVSGALAQHLPLSRLLACMVVCKGWCAALRCDAVWLDLIRTHFVNDAVAVRHPRAVFAALHRSRWWQRVAEVEGWPREPMRGHGKLPFKVGTWCARWPDADVLMLPVMDVTAAALDPQGLQLALGGASGTVQVWSLQRGGQVGKLGLKSIVTHLSVCSEWVVAATAGTIVGGRPGDGKFPAVHVLRVGQGGLRKHLPTIQVAHAVRGVAVAMVPSADPVALVGEEASPTLQLWNVESGALIEQRGADGGGLLQLRASHDKDVVVTLSKSLVIEQWSMAAGLTRLTATAVPSVPADALTLCVSGASVVLGGLRPATLSVLPLADGEHAELAESWQHLMVKDGGEVVWVLGGDEDVVVFDGLGNSTYRGALHTALPTAELLRVRDTDVIMSTYSDTPLALEGTQVLECGAGAVVLASERGTVVLRRAVRAMTARHHSGTATGGGDTSGTAEGGGVAEVIILGRKREIGKRSGMKREGRRNEAPEGAAQSLACGVPWQSVRCRARRAPPRRASG